MVSALDTLAAELAASRPTDEAAYAERLRAYLDAHPAFYGSAAALLDQDGKVTASPYVYRTSDGYATLGPCGAVLQHRVAGLGHGAIGLQRGRLDGALF